MTGLTSWPVTTERRPGQTADRGGGMNILPGPVVLLVSTDDTKDTTMLKDFYVSFSAVCFTLLGLWLIVVQTRHAEWRGSPARRRRVYAVALHFSLPGLMSLLALVDPESTALWRASFAIAAFGGAAAPIALRRCAGQARPGCYISAVAGTLIGTLAITPHVAGASGSRPRRYESRPRCSPSWSSPGSTSPGSCYSRTRHLTRPAKPRRSTRPA